MKSIHRPICIGPLKLGLTNFTRKMMKKNVHFDLLSVSILYV